MKKGFSLGMDVTINEDNQYDASIAYLDTDDNDFTAEAQGDNLEEVCVNLYNSLLKEMASSVKDNDNEDMSDEDYIAYLEEMVQNLKNENQKLKRVYNTIDSDRAIRQVMKRWPGFGYAFSW